MTFFNSLIYLDLKFVFKCFTNNCKILKGFHTNSNAIINSNY